MACYNSEKWVRDAILSVANQDYKHWELLICDDFSKDRSLEAINNAVEDFKIPDKVKVYNHNRNRGYGYTLWDMARRVTGQIITILDSDDMLYNSKVLEKIAKVHRKYPHVSLTYSNYMECSEAMIPKRLYKTRQIAEGESYIDVVGDHMKRAHKARISHLKAFKRVHYMATEGYDKTLTNTVDKDLNLKLEEVGKLMHINDVLYLYRMHSDNISRSISKKSKEERQRIANDRKEVFSRANNRRTRLPSMKWQDEKKCKALQAKWGDYDKFISDPSPTKKDIIKVLRKIIKTYPLKPSAIDIGCGAGHFMWVVKNWVSELTGLDHSPAMLFLSEEQFENTEIIKPSLKFGTCWETGYPDNSFDLSYQVDVCMHVGDSWKSILEMIRISKKHVIFTGPSFSTGLTSAIDKKFETGKRWKISIPLLSEKLNKLKELGKIKGYEFKYRESTSVYNHKILVIEK